jgi:signal transduction histidine kinase
MVGLRMMEAKTILVAQDDGIGLDIEAVELSDGFGLKGIRERIQSIEGKILFAWGLGV